MQINLCTLDDVTLYRNNYIIACDYVHVQDLLQPIFVSPEDYGDLYLDIADAYMETSES